MWSVGSSQKPYDVENISYQIKSMKCFLQWNDVYKSTYHRLLMLVRAFLVTQTVKNPPCNLGYLGSIPGLGRSPGEGNSYPLQYSGLENSMDKGAWQATVHGDHKEWDTTERLSHTHKCYLHTITSSYIGSIQSSSRRMYCGTKDKGLTRSHPD